MKPAQEARSRARECLWQAINANSTAETVKWLHEAEDWIRRGRDVEPQQGFDVTRKSTATCELGSSGASSELPLRDS